jgi:hypothetical protein
VRVSEGNTYDAKYITTTVSNAAFINDTIIAFMKFICDLVY